LSNEANRAEILVLGTGNFGTCLGNHLAHLGHPVLMWGRSQDIVGAINTSHKNPKYLSHIELSTNLSATTTLSKELIARTKFLILAIPTQSLRTVLAGFKHDLSPDVVIVCAVKGIENETLCFPYNIIEQELGLAFSDRTVILSGPSFAIEVAERQPTAVSVAAKNQEVNRLTQELFHSSFFRVYTTDDPIGLEVAGALKNVIALASGAAAGLGFQQNAKAALLARGLAEISRLGVVLGAQAITFMGLGGVGDVFLTCTSEKSRNFTVGYRLGKGESLQNVLNTLGSVAEGVWTTKAAHELAKNLKVDAPIIHAVYSVLYEGQTIDKALFGLLNREMKAEVTLPTHSD
jgi:glycerol-3-phosphate dehydrogenase (NAD(P)+)